MEQNVEEAKKYSESFRIDKGHHPLRIGSIGREKIFLKRMRGKTLIVKCFSTHLISEKLLQELQPFEQRIVQDFIRHNFTGFLQSRQFFPESNVMTEFFHNLPFIFCRPEVFPAICDRFVHPVKIAPDFFHIGFCCDPE